MLKIKIKNYLRYLKMNKFFMIKKKKKKKKQKKKIKKKIMKKIVKNQKIKMMLLTIK